jgi:hypothetical protein
LTETGTKRWGDGMGMECIGDGYVQHWDYGNPHRSRYESILGKMVLE